MAEGWVRIHRAIMDHWIYQDAEYFKVWMEMLLRARYIKEPVNEMIEGELVKIGHGEFIFGRVKWSERLKVGEQRLRTLLKKLQTEEMIVLVSTHRKCTVYRICNYENYQNMVFNTNSSSVMVTQDDFSFLNHQANHEILQAQQEIAASINHEDNQHLTSSQPSPNQQPTTKKESKESNKEINNISSSTSTVPRTNPYELFEKHNFGVLDDATRYIIGYTIDDYTEIWVKMAILEAVKFNKKSWIYVERILKRWKTLGHQEPWTVPWEDKQKQQPANVTPIYQRRGNGRQKPVMPVVDNAPGKKLNGKERDELVEMAKRLEENSRNRERELMS